MNFDLLKYIHISAFLCQAKRRLKGQQKRPLIRKLQFSYRCRADRAGRQSGHNLCEGAVRVTTSTEADTRVGIAKVGCYGRNGATRPVGSIGDAPGAFILNAVGPVDAEPALPYQLWNRALIAVERLLRSTPANGLVFSAWTIWHRIFGMARSSRVSGTEEIPWPSPELPRD
jgi:hypothetical protein